MSVKEVREVTADVIYRFGDNPGINKSIVYAFQWLSFSIGFMLLVPIIIGPPLGLNTQQMASLLQRVFFFTGIASLLTVFFGHRLPLVEGPSNVWVALFVGFGTTAAATGMPLELLRTNLETAMIIAGVVVALFGVTKLVSKAMFLFTPVVTGSVLVLVALQLSGGYIKSALGVGFQNQPFSWVATIISIIIISVVVLISLKAPPFFRSFAVIIGVLLGWAMFSVMGLTNFSTLQNVKPFSLPTLFDWGAPTFDLGVTISCVVVGLILTANVVASIIAVNRVSKTELDEKSFNKGVIFNGVANVLAGGGATVGSVSFATSAGLVSITGVASRIPFILFSGLLIIMGFIPAIGTVMATIPAPVGNAVALAAMCTLFSFGVKDYTKLTFDNRDSFILGLSIMVGVGVMFLPATAVNALPKWLSYIVGNGLISGMLTCILLEHVLLSKRLFVAKSADVKE